MQNPLQLFCFVKRGEQALRTDPQVHGRFRVLCLFRHVHAFLQPRDFHACHVHRPVEGGRVSSYFGRLHCCRDQHPRDNRSPQIFSMHDSKSSAANSGVTVAAGAFRSFAFALLLGATDSAPVFLVPGVDRKEVPAVPREAFSDCFPKAFSSACSTSVRNPSSLSKAWLTVRSVYSC